MTEQEREFAVREVLGMITEIEFWKESCRQLYAQLRERELADEEIDAGWPNEGDHLRLRSLGVKW